MATIVHDNFRNAQLGNPAAPTTTVDFDADDVRCSLIDATDVTITASMDSYDDVDADPVAEGAAIASKQVGTTTGVFDSTVDYTFSSVGAGLDEADYLVLYKYNATPANATLIITWDSATTGLPVQPNGGDITVTWNASGILQI